MHTITLRAIISVSVLSFLTTAAFAATTGPLISDRWGSTKVSFEYNHSFERDIDAEDAVYSGENIEDYDQYYGVLGRKIYEKNGFALTVYTKLGTGNVETAKTHTKTGFKEKISYEQGFLWGVGFNVTASLPDKAWDIVWDSQYLQSFNDLDEVVLNENIATGVEGETGMDFNEWQTSLIFQTYYDFGDKYKSYTLAPYAGVVLSWTELDGGTITYNASDTAVTANTSSQQDDILGVVLGAEFYPMEQVSIRVDGRLLADDGVSVAANYEF